MQLRDYQEACVEQVLDHFEAGHKSVLLIAGTGSGKCLGRGTPVMRHDGTVVPVEQIEVGDLLMGPDSQPRRVESLARGRENLWRVVPTKGDPYVVNESHILSFKLTNDGTGWARQFNGEKFYAGDTVNLTVADYLAQPKKKKHLLKAWRTGVDFPNAGPLHPEMPAYMLGLWLGDGGQGLDHCTEISKPDPEVLEAVGSYAASIGCTVRTSYGSTGCPSHSVTTGERFNGQNPMRDALRSLDLIQNRHIPHAYKCGSRQTRLEVLAGYLDADGHQAGGYFDAITKVERLADDICFVARSLGFAAYKSRQFKRNTTTGVGDWYWRLSISGDGLHELPCRIPRRKAPPRQQSKNVLRTGIKLEPLGEGDYFGFTLSGPDRLFLLGDFTVTHNTAMATQLVKDFWEAGLPVVFQVTLDTLVAQTFNAFTKMGVPEDQIGIIRGGEKEHRDRPIQIASQQTLLRRDWWKRRNWGLIVEDEAHVSGFSTCAKRTREALPRARYLGLTATPFRLSPRQGFDHYTAQVNAPAPAQLQEQGFLSRMRYFSLPTAAVDLKGVKTIAGDFAAEGLKNACNRPEVIEASVAEWKRKAEGLRTITFAIDVAHAAAIRDAFNNAGIPSEIVTGETPRARRAELYQALHDRELLVLSSCMALATGFDLPSAECGLLMRPTKSQALHIQQIGRIARPWDEKDHGVILDQAGNCGRFRFGLLEDLPTDLKRQMPNEPKGGAGGVTTKICPECDAICRNFDQECPHCGHSFAKEVVAHTGPLVELKRKAEQQKKEPPESRLKAQFHKLRKTAFQRGLLPKWAEHRFKEVTDTDPKPEWFAGSTFRKANVSSMQSYATYLALMADRRGIRERELFIIGEMNKEFPGLNWPKVVDLGCL